MYGEHILYWMLDNAVDGHEVDDHEMQEGCGLPEFEYFIGIAWLTQNGLINRRDNAAQ
jgi:hypothetical protein